MTDDRCGGGCTLRSGRPRAENRASLATGASRDTLPIRAYVGLPLTRDDGTLFGTLCAIDPDPKPEALVRELPLFETCARLLSTVLAADLRRQESERRAARAEADAMTDHLTGLYNRRGWELLVAQEEARCRRYGHPAVVLSIDVDGLKSINDSLGHAAGDALLKRTAEVLQGCLRRSDVIARLGGDEFAVLLAETRDAAGASARVEVALREAGVLASVGAAHRRPEGGLAAALVRADAAMYDAKRARRRLLGREPTAARAAGDA